MVRAHRAVLAALPGMAADAVEYHARQRQGFLAGHGEYEPANFRVTDLVHHFRVWGPIQEQLRDLPDGATVEFKVVE